MTSTIVLLTSIHPNAPVARARETLSRLLSLLGQDKSVSAAQPDPTGPKLTLIRGGKQEGPVKPTAA